MPTLWHRLKYLLLRKRMDADLAEEIESHRAMLEERLRQSGLPPRDATAASRRVLGNVALAREDAREIWIGRSVESVVQDVRHALRALARNPGFGFAVVLVTALGIGAATTVFGLVNRLILKPLPVSHPGQLVYFSQPSFSYPVFEQVLVTIVGLAAGAGASLALSRIAGNLLYQISPNDVLSLAAATALLIAVAALAALVPSVRASRVDPAHALKAE
jgi:hypothetical protein